MGEGVREELGPLLRVSLQGPAWLCTWRSSCSPMDSQWNLISAYSEPVSLDSWVSHGLRPGKLRAA